MSAVFFSDPKETGTMAENEKKDVLKEILSDSGEDFIPGLEELEKLIHRFVTTPESAPVRKTRKIPKKKKIKKKKTSYYLTEEIFNNLGDAKETIRKMLPEVKKSKISKTRIVNSALKMILKEFEKKGSESLLVRQISKREPNSR